MASVDDAPAHTLWVKHEQKGCPVKRILGLLIGSVALLLSVSVSAEFPPDMDGYVIESDGTLIGRIGVDTGDQTLIFYWTSASVAWPDSFEIRPGTSPDVNEKHIYEHTTFPTNLTSVDLSTCQYRIVQTSGTIGYLNKRTDGLDWYTASSAVAGGYFNSGAMTFKKNTHTGTLAVYHIDDDAL